MMGLLRPRSRPHRHAIFLFLLLQSSLLPSPWSRAHAEDDARVLQNNNNNDDNQNVCTHHPPTNPSYPTSSDEVIDQVLFYLDEHRPLIEQTILVSYTDHFENVTRPSAEYLYDDFRDSLEWMAREGVARDDGQRYAFYLGPDNCDNDGWHVGLANVAAFLGQSMTMVIGNDTCDELNWEAIIPDPFAEEPKWYYPLSNACGQRGVSYTDAPFHQCPAGEERYQCKVDPTLKLTAASKSVFEGDVPPELQCFPRTNEKTTTGHYDPNPFKGDPGIREEPGNVIPAKTGRTDAEGCCYWGRGALHTRGVCSLGKLNHFLGKRARDEGRKSRYPDIDFCSNPEAICNDATRTMELRWTVALFEWVERIQSFNDEEMGWNYVEGLTKFMESEDVLSSVEMSLQRGEPSHFIDEVAGILEQGCPFPPCNLDNPNRLQWKGRRKRNFLTALQAVGLPVKSSLFQATEAHFEKFKENFEDQILRSRSPMNGKFYQSYRYLYDDFMESLRKMADVGFDGNFFYIGQGDEEFVDGGEESVGRVSGPSNPGLVNIAIFLSYAIEMAILDDACDEHNTQLVNGRHPVSNSCGMYGESYQDIVCDADGPDAGSECPLDLTMSFSAVTRTLDHRAPQPFKCAPKSQYPVTGFWDEARLEENHKTAFNNQIGRVDVEGCCWWGRGVLRQLAHGRCVFGQMNRLLGAGAASDGRPALYPEVDFCQFPEAICASEFSNELRWVSGMFLWVKRMQSFDDGKGWSYMDIVRDMSIFVDGELDKELLMQVDCVLRTGKIDCDSPVDMSDRLNELLTLITTFNLPTQSPTASLSPTVVPTGFPTLRPTDEPTLSPTDTVPPTASPNIFWYPSRQDVDFALQILQENRAVIQADLLSPRVEIDDNELYSFTDLAAAVKVFADGSVQGLYFYVGHDSNREFRRRGLVNIAAFLAHAKTVAIHDSICDERNEDGIQNKYPLSNSCGQFGETYQNLRCAPSESFMECPPDPGLQMTAVAAPLSSEEGTTVGVNIDGSTPPPFFCGPRSYFPYTGYFDGESNAVMNDEPFANRAGRTDVQSCCWWGRGAAQIKGTCLYGKLNYYIGARAKEEGRRSLFPSVDFCQNPQAICSGEYSYSLMWMSAMLVWVEEVQAHISSYLEMVVDGEMREIDFIDAISDIVGSNEEDKSTRRINFEVAMDALGMQTAIFSP